MRNGAGQGQLPGEITGSPKPCERQNWRQNWGVLVSNGSISRAFGFGVGFRFCPCFGVIILGTDTGTGASQGHNHRHRNVVAYGTIVILVLGRLGLAQLLKIT
ncbi:hypothetical protein L484_020560 [Morus notabilis]|uniref:Uncharacterized protein n=1 Tax=Morus notabilis TaxID=981085 RepID=W9S0T2_9ROSA|nr:hypothetical protein L484_020560 [Morus notabilis]